jgi:hypothetical protein
MNPHPTRRSLLGGAVAALLGLLHGTRDRVAAQGTRATPLPAATTYTHDANRVMRTTDPRGP